MKWAVFSLALLLASACGGTDASSTPEKLSFTDTSFAIPATSATGTTLDKCTIDVAVIDWTASPEQILQTYEAVAGPCLDRAWYGQVAAPSLGFGLIVVNQNSVSFSTSSTAAEQVEQLVAGGLPTTRGTEFAHGGNCDEGGTMAHATRFKPGQFANRSQARLVLSNLMGTTNTVVSNDDVWAATGFLDNLNCAVGYLLGHDSAVMVLAPDEVQVTWMLTAIMDPSQTTPLSEVPQPTATPVPPAATGDISTVNALVPAGSSLIFEHRSLKIDRERMTITAATPVGWDFDDEDDEFTAASLSEASFWTRMTLDTSCNGACGARDWAHFLNTEGRIAELRAERDLISDEALDDGWLVVYRDANEDVRVKAWYWNFSADKFVTCSVSIDKADASLADAFAAACSQVSVNWS